MGMLNKYGKRFMFGSTVAGLMTVGYWFAAGMLVFKGEIYNQWELLAGITTGYFVSMASLVSIYTIGGSYRAHQDPSIIIQQGHQNVAQQTSEYDLPPTPYKESS